MKESYVSFALKLLSERIGISQTQRENADKHYRGITRVLDNSSLASYKPRLQTQGSNRLGTAVRCVGNENDFDIDIVCELLDIPSNWTPKDLKEAVGEVLLESNEYKDLIENKKGGKRCWTILYKDGTHADILPSVVDEAYRRNLQNTYYQSFDEFGIRITDKTRHPEYEEETDRSKWLLSNPIGFAEWFFMMARVHENKHKSHSYMRTRASVQPFPVSTKSDWMLQSIVRLLKRHRDVMFEGDDKKPISMIITVLAAKAYETCPPGNNMLDIMKHISNNLISVMDRNWYNGRRQVLNPVNPKEDFSDRWQKEPEREQNFYRWVEQLCGDFETLSTMNRVDAGIKLKQMFGENAGTDVIKDLVKREQESKSPSRLAALGTAVTTTASAVAKVMPAMPHTFYGI